MLPLDAQDIHRACGLAATEAGRRYHQQARVVGFAREGDTIQSIVKGSERHPYRQAITLRPGRLGSAIASRCTCPVAGNCKHVAAALFHAITVATASGGREGQLARLVGAPQHATAGPSGSPIGAGVAEALPPGLSAWIDDLVRASIQASEAYPPDVAQRMIYLIMPIRDEPRLSQLGVQPISARLRKDGTFAANGRPYTGNGIGPGTPRHFRPSDSRILRDLPRLPTTTQARTLYCLTDDAGAEILALVLATGRARWLALDGPVLRAGPTQEGHLSWGETKAGALRPCLTLDREATVLAATPPVYVDPGAGLVGSIETGQPPRIAAALLRAPPVAPTALAAVAERFGRQGSDLAALAPPVHPTERRTGVTPIPCLRLFVAVLPEVEEVYHGYVFPSAQVKEVALARLSFRYGDVVVPLGETRSTVTRFAGGRLVELDRDPIAEAAAVRLILSHGFEPAPDLRDGVPAEHARDLMPGDQDLDWLTTLYEAVPELVAAGWEIAVAPDFPYRMVRADGGFEAELREGSGVDWLDLHLGMVVDGERIDLVELLVALIGSSGFSLGPAEGAESDGDEAIFLPLPDGRTLGVPVARLRPIVEALRDLAFGADRGPGSLRLSRTDAARLAAFEAATTGDAFLTWRGGEALRALGRRLAIEGGLPPVMLPPGFRAVLRPYQEAGVAWLSLLREVGLGGVLADDMGLGKTVQALAFLAVEKAAGRLDRPALLVAPTSLMGNWAAEAARFAPDLRVLTLHGLGRRAAFDAIAAHDLVLTTYPLVARDHAVLAGQVWSVMLLDEAQVIKNPDAATTKLIGALEARHRFALTGTPLENNLGELWSLFAFACPGLLGERKAFTTAWRVPIEKRGDAVVGQRLARRVRPFLLRRTKDAVASELPPKTETVERVEFRVAQRDVYEAIRLSMHARIRTAVAEKGWARSRIVILDALLKLRQACCDPRLLKLRTRNAAAAGSVKLERLEALLGELLAEGRRVIVFSQFTTMLEFIRQRLETLAVPYAMLTGSTVDRPAAIAAFDSGAAAVFLVSLKAGGVGLNLVSADTVILYDPWWNPAVEAQAIDRIHRLGQTRPVFVHKLVVADTIEEKMEVLKEKKAALAASLFDPEAGSTLAITEADIEMLLALVRAPAARPRTSSSCTRASSASTARPAARRWPTRCASCCTPPPTSSC